MQQRAWVQRTSGYLLHRGWSGSAALCHSVGYRAAMSDETDLESKEREERWQAWLAKGRLRDQATARRVNVLLTFVVLTLIALGMAAYWSAH